MNTNTTTAPGVAPPLSSDASSSGATPRWPTGVMAAATLLAVVLGLWKLGSRSLWYDEAFTVGIVDRPIGDVAWRLTHWEVNQSPYYLLFAGWFRLGHTEEFLRLLSVAFAVAAVPAIFLLGRRIADARVGAVAAVLLAVHPLVVQWGQQLRSYSMVVLLVIVATILLLRAVDEPGNTSRSMLYAVVAAVTIYTQFFALLVIVAHLVWVALLRPIPRRVVAAAGVALAVLVVPLAWYLATYQGDPLVWLAGSSDNILVAARGLTGGRGINVVAYTVAVLAGLWALTRLGKRVGLGALRTPKMWPSVLPLVWLIVPVAITLVVSLTVKPLLEARFLLVVVPALVLVAAYGLCHLPWRPIAAVLAAALLVVSLDGLRIWYRGPMLENWRAAVPVAIQRAGPDGSLVLDPHLALFAVRYYRPDGAHFHLFEPEWYHGRKPPKLVEVIRDRQRPHELGPLYELWRDTYYAPVGSQHFEGLTVNTFELKR